MWTGRPFAGRHLARRGLHRLGRGAAAAAPAWSSYFNLICCFQYGNAPAVPQRPQCPGARLGERRLLLRHSPPSGISPAIPCTACRRRSPRASGSASAMPCASAASRYQRLRQLRQKPARFIRSMFCTSVRSRRCSTRRRNAAASSSVRVASGRARVRAWDDLLFCRHRWRGDAPLRHTPPRNRREGSQRWPGTTRARGPALRAMFDAAVAAADPRRVLAAPPAANSRAGRCVVVGAGKSAAVMAAALEDAWPDVPLDGVVVTRYGHARADAAHRGAAKASHPVPDANGEAAARRILAPCAARAGRSGAGADLRRRLGAAAAAGAGADARRQAGGQPGAAGLGRDDLAR